MLDLQHAIAFLRRTRIRASTDYSNTVDSGVCIITANTQHNPKESRLNLLQRNLTTFKRVVLSLVEHSPETLLVVVVVLNPIEVMTNIEMWYSRNLRNKYKYMEV
ncbi:hypothetical protein Cni_G15680 [Canna indica]|uniref:Lactate/malate dehydrogenase N-terminal domain-containing protein n=1 Tax=Canna indica TaxID=4628 RepID=A0AAQ3QG10_9LILI|nr:hypothetical protein Cni_G15680 [Canna indica]